MPAVTKAAGIVTIHPPKVFKFIKKYLDFTGNFKNGLRNGL